MSTQLILYPQNYIGEYSSTTTNNTTTSEEITNGDVFTGLNSTTLYNTNASPVSTDAIINSPPSILGDWYRYTTTGVPWGAVTAPAVVLGGKVELQYNAGTEGHTGIYQQMSGLVPGVIYTVKVAIATPLALSGVVKIEFWTGTNLDFQYLAGSNTNLITTTFTASATNHIFLIDYVGYSGALFIENISVSATIVTPSNIYTELTDGQVICDLYQEEDIPLTLSIDDFKNVAEQVKSYSKDFNLPATKRNNQIFNNMFEVTRTAQKTKEFNPYARTKCVLKQDGFILFEGFLRLIDVKDKEGEISYNVNLYSEVIALADILKDQTFATLDFSELEHDYNYTEIRESWQGTLTVAPLPADSFANNTGVAGATTTNVLKYPFIDWNHQFTHSLTTGFPVLPNLESAFRPCIRLKYLIDTIFAASGFNYTSEFFNTTDFKKLYMDFNWGADNAPVVYDLNGEIVRLGDQAIGTGFTTLVGNVVQAGFPDNAGYDDTTGIFTSPYNGQTYTITFEGTFTTSSGTNTVDVEWVHYIAALGVSNPINPATLSVNSINPTAYSSSFTRILNVGDTLYCRAIKASASPGVSLDGALFPFSSYPLMVVAISLNQTTDSTLLTTLRGELGQWDFLKGIMTMFNLVSLADESDPNNILIEPYSDIFINNTNSTTATTPNNNSLAARSIQHDWTDKVDVSEMELKPLTDLNKETIFKFVEDEDDHAFKVYKNSNSGHLYGSYKQDASLSSFNLPTMLQGIEEIIAEPFAATVSKPLMSQFPDFVVPSLYSMTDDGTTEGFDNSPRIFYSNYKKTLTSCTYNVPCQNQPIPCGDATEDEFLQFSHLTTIPSISATTTDFVFKSEDLIGLGGAPIDNLWSVYWQPYFAELYNADTRTMTLKVNLSPSDIAAFKFYDMVFIKNRSFRVNKIDYKPNDLATVEFILIP